MPHKLHHDFAQGKQSRSCTGSGRETDKKFKTARQAYDKFIVIYIDFFYWRYLNWCYVV